MEHLASTEHILIAHAAAKDKYEVNDATLYDLLLYQQLYCYAL